MTLTVQEQTFNTLCKLAHLIAGYKMTHRGDTEAQENTRYIRGLKLAYGNTLNKASDYALKLDKLTYVSDYLILVLRHLSK